LLFQSLLNVVTDFIIPITNTKIFLIETIDGSRWFRDPKKAVPSNEITRFPHAVLEVKLQLLGEGATPPWVTDLINSGTPF
jgi:SPX domain protein involved in polyphosphate accumulation